jgi:DNA polymerase-1
METIEDRSFDKLRTKPKLVLIDSNAIIHRSYHALPKNMSTSRGEPTNAVYGFTTTLIKVLEDLKPDYLAASFDMRGPTFRHEQFKDYKATRVKADQELYDQIPRVKELLNVMDIPIYEKEGFEADDIIGTIVSRLTNKFETLNPKSETNPNDQNPKKLTAESSKLEAYIVSGDKDIFQLVDGNIKVYNLKKGLSQTQIVDREFIKKEYSLDPEDFIDLKALAGDPSDNIPGVPGIGAKTATSLIQQFDSLEKLYQKLQEASEAAETLNQISNIKYQNDKSKLKNINVEETAEKLNLKPRIVQLLIDNKEQAFMSQKLATIEKDVPINFSLEEMKWGEYDRNKPQKFFEELGFNSLLRRFGEGRTEELKNQKTEGQSKKDKQLKLL